MNFSVEKVIVFVGGILFCVVFGLQVWHSYTFNQRLNSFVNKGPRFTAADGQILCSRVLELERRLGINQTICDYNRMK